MQDPERKERGKKQHHKPGLPESRLWPLQGSAWETPRGQGMGGRGCPRKLVDIQESPPPSSAMVPPKEREVMQMWQDTCVAEQGALGKTHTLEGSVQRVAVNL